MVSDLFLKPFESFIIKHTIKLNITEILISNTQFLLAHLQLKQVCGTNMKPDIALPL